MSTFRLSSDKQFIMPSVDDVTDLFVFDYLDDPYVIEFIRRSPICGDWGRGVRVGPSSAAQFRGLEVFGTTIKGARFMELIKDLTLRGVDDDAGVFRLIVNRLGICLLTRIDHPSFQRLRINDYFGWSKYGVRVPRGVINGGNVWDKCDIYSGAVVVDVQGTMRAAEEASEEAKELVERMEEMEEEVVAGKLELAVRDTALEYVKEVVERSKVNEVLWRKLVEEKERELESVNKLLLAFKAVVKSLVDDQGV